MEEVKAKGKSKPLWIDAVGLTKNLDLEQKLRTTLTWLLDFNDKALGDRNQLDSYTSLINIPDQYLTKRYWELHCEHRPDHLDKYSIFESDTGINLSKLRDLAKEWKSLVEQMNDDCKPTITNEGIEWNTTKDKFEFYLNKEAKPHYDAIQNLIKAFEQLKKFEPNIQPIHINRLSDNIRINGLSLDVIKERFILK